jgi:hypothetical protein
MNCPFCGAVESPGFRWFYQCGFRNDPNSRVNPFKRPSACYETQLSAQKEVIREMGNWMKLVGWPCHHEMIEGEQKFYDEGTKILNRPEVRKIMEDKGDDR